MKRRIFIAVNLPARTKEALAGFADKVKRANPQASIKWTGRENLHLTLHFLGYLDESVLEKAKKAAKKAAGFCGQKSVGLEIGKLGGFPSLKRPRIIFASVQGRGIRILSGLREILGKELERSGFEIEKRPWKSHITLGRARNPSVRIKIPERGIDGEKFRIGSIDVMESFLSPKGPKYRVLAKYPLKQHLR